MDPIDVAEQFDKHLSSPKQSWLLGAGIGFGANIPLMWPLTERVLKLAREQEFRDDDTAIRILDFIQNDISESSHIEDLLTHLGDYISISERSRTNSVTAGENNFTKPALEGVHLKLLELIAETIQWGYRPSLKDANENEVAPELVGKVGAPIVEIDHHSAFVKAVFGTNRAGLDHLRQSVEFFTTNYDTLLEDALALNGIVYQDGFSGGGVAFWRAENFSHDDTSRAVVTKLHGSSDWFRSRVRPSTLLRVRYGDGYPQRQGGAVMIYPQATKYLTSQEDPFSELFQRFRRRLKAGKDHVLLICGYSFGDEHINAEIDLAMSADKSQLTILVFSNEPHSKLPKNSKNGASELGEIELYR